MTIKYLTINENTEIGMQNEILLKKKKVAGRIQHTKSLEKPLLHQVNSKSCKRSCLKSCHFEFQKHHGHYNARGGKVRIFDLIHNFYFPYWLN